MSSSGQGSRVKGRSGGAQSLIDKGKVVQKIRPPLPVPGTGQASSSPMSEDGNDKELLNSICQLHRQIRADHTPAKDIVSAIGELKREIQYLISELADPEENTEATPKSVKSKHGERKTTASGTTNSKDLYTVATTTRNKCWKFNSDLVKTRKELKEISELAVAVGQEAGFMPDTRNVGKDSLKINAKGALEDIKQRNKALSEELHKLRQNIESYSTDQTEQQPKQQHSDKNQPPSRPRKQPQTTNQTKQKDHKSYQVDTNLEIVSKAVSTFDDLRLYKSTYEQMLKYVWKTTNTAAIHVNELTSNNKGPDKFQIVKLGEVQNDEIDQFNRLVVNMIKTIEGFVERDTRSGDEIQKLKREIEIKVKENEALHNRLSKMAGNKMTEGSPNIATLGDPNRPTKIAEIYSEIYDNEWTDTLDFCLKELGKEYSEDEALQALNKTLIICYKICEEKSDEWIQKAKEKLQHCTRELMVNFQSDEILMQIIQGRKVDPDKRSQQLLKEIRPKKDLVATKYDKEMNSSKLYKMIIQNKFFEKCFTLCWKMIVQNPRMILVEGPSKGETYDRNIFREFTSSGSKVVFTVWPALYLHEDGPLLVKGVLRVE